DRPSQPSPYVFTLYLFADHRHAPLQTADRTFFRSAGFGIETAAARDLGTRPPCCPGGCRRADRANNGTRRWLGGSERLSPRACSLLMVAPQSRTAFDLMSQYGTRFPASWITVEKAYA